MISVDTVVVHLAGALDIPVWTMLQHNADFRWMRVEVILRGTDL